VGLIEGVSDGLSSFAKMASGYYTDKLRRRKPSRSSAISSRRWARRPSAGNGRVHVLLARAFCVAGRGVAEPVRKALLAGSVTKETYGRAFGFERMMDTLAAIVGPATAFFLPADSYRCITTLFAVTAEFPSLIRGGIDCILSCARRSASRWHTFHLVNSCGCAAVVRKFLVAVGLFGAWRLRATTADFAGDPENSRRNWARRKRRASRWDSMCCTMCYAGFAFVAGWLADRFPKICAGDRLCAGGSDGARDHLPAADGLDAGRIFILGGVYVAMEERWKIHSARNWGEEHQRMAFGHTGDGERRGDFLSSIIVGTL